MTEQTALPYRLRPAYSPEAYHQFIDRIHPDGYRREVVAALAHAIHAKENRLLIGLPDVGVSNLLRFLVTRVDLTGRETLFIYLNCDVLYDCREEELFFDEIARQVADQVEGAQVTTAASGLARLLHLLTRLEASAQRRLVVVADKTDRMLTAASPPFYRRLKGLTDLNKGVCFLFAVGVETADRVDPDHLLFAGRRLYVGLLDEQDMAGAIQEEAQRLGTQFDASTQDRLARLAGGHPGLLRAISSAVVEERLDSNDPEAVWLGRLLAREDVRRRCQKVWACLSPAQQRALRALLTPETATTDRFQALPPLGLARRWPDGRYELFSPVFAGYVAGQPEPGDEQRIRIAMGKVFRGGQAVRLRPLEQKLLACLMAEPGRVYTHDEIALTVWNTVEVTPDMINGLVSQLRARLGKSYIKTHWRRGYEFVP
jgi:hypothetical protein